VSHCAADIVIVVEHDERVSLAWIVLCMIDEHATE